MMIPVLHASVSWGFCREASALRGNDLFFPYFLASLSHYFVASIQSRNRVPLLLPPMEIVHRNVQINVAARRLLQSILSQFSGITPREIAVDSSLKNVSRQASLASEGSAILGAEGDSDLIGEFLQRRSVRGEQWGFLEKIGGVRQVGERALLAFGDGRTLRGKAAGEQEILSPAILHAWFHLLRLAQILTEQVQVISEPTHGIKKLFFGLGNAKYV